ncbi:uncharacterized protein DS421_3g92390 [Arachis hypogaea]|nr:uncharacterized protein DS421_3g92390 [Arachis hypogaea]
MAYPIRFSINNMRRQSLLLLINKMDCLLVASLEQWRKYLAEGVVVRVRGSVSSPVWWSGELGSRFGYGRSGSDSNTGPVCVY